MTYDSFNRVLTKSYSGIVSPVTATPNVTYTYDTDLPITGHTEPNYPWGRLASVSNTVSTTTFRYDALGQALSSVQATNGGSYVFGYNYGPIGLTSETYPTQRLVQYGYDSAGRINSVTGTLGGSTTYASLTSPTAYAPQGAIALMTLGNGMAETTTYNSRLQPTSIQAGNLLSLGYTYGESNGNDNGNVQSQTITRGAQSWAQSYGYDGLNRLCAAFEVTGTTPVGVTTSCTAQSTPAWAQSFGYDIAGNRWIGTSPGPLTLSNETPQGNSWFGSNTCIDGTGSSCTGGFWSGSPNNQIVQTGWSYDNAGNITGISTLSRTFAYDAENRQTSASINGTTPAYAYDGDGQRVSKTTSAGTTTYVYDAMGALAAEYPAVLPSVGGTRYLTADMLGSTRLVTDGGGNQAECEDYLPFGEQLTSSVDGRPSCYAAPDVVPEKKFTGKERDAESGLDFFGARYISSAQGRFTSPDWSAKPEAVPYADLSDPQTLNLYSYVRNNPLSKADADGHCFWDLCVGEATAAYAAGTAVVAGAVYLSTPQGKEATRSFIQGIGTLINKGVDALSSLIPGTSTEDQLSTGTPGTPAGTTITAGTPASTSQPGTVDTSPIESRLFPQGVKADHSRPN